MIVLTNCCREPHSSYLIWGKCLGSVGCWPGATIDRLLVVFQGEAGGGRPAERTEGPAGGRAVFHGNSHKQLSLDGVYFLASISYPWYEMNWFSHCPPARPFTRRRSVSWRTSVMRRTNWSKKHSSDWQNMRRRGNCSLVCSHNLIPSPDTITRDTAAPAWPVICFKQHRKPKKDKKMKPKDNYWIQCKSRTCKEKIYWYTNNRPPPPEQGFPDKPAGGQFDQGGLRAAGSLHRGGAVLRPGEGEDHEGAGDQRHDGETQTGARRQGGHHQLGETRSGSCDFKTESLEPRWGAFFCLYLRKSVWIFLLTSSITHQKAPLLSLRSNRWVKYISILLTKVFIKSSSGKIDPNVTKTLIYLFKYVV